MDTTEIRSLHDAGMSERKIADQLGVSRHSVRKALGERSSVAVVPQGDRTGIDTYVDHIVSAVGRSSRLSVDTPGRKNNNTLFKNVAMITDDTAVEGDSRFEWMDGEMFRRKTVPEMIEIAIASSPEVGRAVWDFHRACVPGWEVQVIDPATKAVHEQGQAIIDAFRRRLDEYHGTEEVLYTKMFTSILVRGSVLSEVYFEDDGRTAVDIAVPDPKTIRFRQINDAVRGLRWQVGQEQDGEFVPLEGETIRYVVHDALPGRPYSRSPLAASVFPAIFLLGIFQDLRRVIANQGWPRVDVSVNVEAVQDMLAEAMNDDNIAENGEVVARVLSSVIAQVQEAVASLRPGDWYVHSSLVEVKDAIGTLGVENIGEVSSVVEALERVAVKALKTMPLLQGISDSASESDANRQWEMWAAGVKALQHKVENSLQAHFETVLRANAIVATVKFRFAEIRAAEELRDAQTAMMKLDNAIKAEQAGYMTGDEAAIYAVGHGIPEAIQEDREPLLNGLPGSQELPTQWADMDTDGGEPVNGNGEGDTATTNKAVEGGYVRAPGDNGPDVLPVVPEKVSVTVMDAMNATDEFDGLFDEWVGLLEAEIVEDGNQ